MAGTTESAGNTKYVWLDVTVNKDINNLKLTEKLGEILGNLETFDDGNSCKMFIRKNDNAHILLIVSGSFGRQIIPDIHDLPQLLVFFVFCGDRQSNEQWSKSYSKIGQVCTDPNELVEAILSYTTAFITSPTTENSYHSTVDGVDLTDVLWIRLLIEVIVRMNDLTEAKNDLIRLWRKINNERTMITDFQTHFQPSRAIWWYYSSSLYRLNNEAIRLLDFNSIYSLRFIIKYVHLQLKEEHAKLKQRLRNTNQSRLLLFRGQRMPYEEFQLLKSKKQGSLYPFTSLFSTSELRSDAIKFAKSPYPSNAIPVLFEVKIDITGTTLPYAKIPDPTDEFEENEILLMIGTIYQVNHIVYDDAEGIWLIKVSLCSEDDPRLKDMIDYIKYEIKESTDLISLADLFVKMGRYDVAKYYYQRYQSQFSPNSQDIKRAWNGLSDLADIQGNYFLAMNNYAEARQCFNEQLDTCKNLPPQHPQYGKCYANLAKIYENEENWTRALEFYQKADGIYQYSLPPFHPDATRIKHSIEKLKSKSQTTARGTGLVTTPKPATLSKTRVSSLTTEVDDTLDSLAMNIVDCQIIRQTMAKDIRSEMGFILWFQLFIEVLLRMPHTSDAKANLIKIWKTNNETKNGGTDRKKHKKREEEIIIEFDRQYRSEKAIWWYTRECGLYRILNRALREQSIDDLLSCRYFMNELSKQLSQLYESQLDDFRKQKLRDDDEKNTLHLFRAQWIEKEEFARMQNSIGSFIAINSFMSTSQNENETKKFCNGTPSEGRRSVLLHITVNRRLPTKPYADIAKFSAFKKEEEILFMSGTIFSIDGITQEEKTGLSIIDLTLCSEDDFELKEVLNYMKKDVGEETSMITLGNVLFQMGQYERAEEIFSQENHKEGLATISEHKGNQALALQDYSRALEYYSETLELRQKIYPPSHPNIGRSYSSIAMVYDFDDQYSKAIDYYERAIKQFKRTMKDSHPLIVQTKTYLQELKSHSEH